MKSYIIRKAVSVSTLLCFVFLSVGLMGQTTGDFQTKATGDWNAVATWEVWNGTAWANTDVFTDFGNYPGAAAGAKTVTILNGHAITLNINPAFSIGSLVFAAGTTSATSVTLTGYTLNVTGQVTFNDPGSNSGDQTLTIGTGTLSCASISMPETAAGENLTVSISTGTLNVSGNITMLTGTATRNVIAFSDAGTLNIGGDFSSNGTFTYSTSTVNYNNSGAQTVGGYTYYNLILSGSGVKTTTSVTVNNILSLEGTATASAAPTYGSSATLRYNTSTDRTAGAEWITPFAATGGVIVDNTGIITMNAAKVFNASVPLTINAGATLATNDLQLTFGGNFVNGGTFNAGSSDIVIANTMATQSIDGFTTTGTVSMTKTAGTATFQGDVTGGGLTMNGNGGTLNLGTTKTHIFSGDLTRTNGTLNCSSSYLKIGGSRSGTTGTFTAGTGTVEWYADGAQTIAGGVTYYNLVLSGSGIKTMPGGITVNNNLSIEGTATLYTNAYSITGNAIGTLSMAENTTLQLGNTGNTSNIQFPLNFTNDKIFLHSNSTVVYQNSSTQTVSAVPTYGNLTTGTGTTKTASAPLTVNGNLTINSGTTLNLGTTEGSTSVLGDALIDGTLTFGGTGIKTVTITGNLSGTGTLNMSTLTHTLNLGGETNTLGTLTTTAVGSTVNYNRSGPQTVFSSSSYRNLTISGSDTKTLSGDITVNFNLSIAAGTFDLGATATTIGVTGTTSIDGTLTFGTTAKTVTLLGPLSGTGTINMDGVGLAHILYVSGPTSEIANFNTTDGSGSTVYYNLNAEQTIFASNQYQNLTISGVNTKTLPNSDVTVKGDLNISAGPLTFTPTEARTLNVLGDLSGAGTLNMSSGSLAHTLNLGGENNSIGTFTTATGSTVNYNRTDNQNVFASTEYQNLNLTGSGTKTASGNITAANLDNAVTLDMAGYTLSATSIDNTSATIRFSGATNGQAISTGTVEYYGTGQTVATGTYNNLTFSNTTGTNTANGNLTVNGTLVTTSGSTLSMGTNTFTALSAVTNNGTIRTLNTSSTPLPSDISWGGTIEYGALAGGQTVVRGTYTNLSLFNTSGTNSAEGNFTVNSSLTTTASGILDMSTFSLLGDPTTVSSNGTIKTAATASALPTGKSWGGTIEYTATDGSQSVITGTYNNLTLSNTTGTNTAGGDLTVDGTLITTAGGTLNMGASYRLLGTLSSITNNGTIKTAVLTATSATPIPTGKNWGSSGTLEYSSLTGDQTIVAGTYNNLTMLNTSGTNTAGGNITVNGSFTSTGGGTLSTASDISFSGATACGASISASAGTVTYGSGSSNILQGIYNNLGMLADGTLCDDITVDGTLTLTGGKITLGTKNLTLTGTNAVGSVTSSRYIVADNTGQLKKVFASGATSAYTLPIGDATNYSPVSLTFSDNSTERTIGVRVTNGTHPNNGTPVAYISRYWTFTDDQVGTYTYDATFTYVDGDRTGDHTSLRVNRWDGAWTQYNTTGASPNLTITGVTHTTSPIGGNDFTGRVNPSSSYTWNGGASASWADPTSWSPNRLSLQDDDILIFDNVTTTATNVPTQTIGKLILVNGSNVSLQSAAAGQTLTISGGADVDLDIPSGCTLQISSTGTSQIGIAFSPAGQEATIAGSLVINANTGLTNSYDATNSTTTVTGTFTNNGGTITSSAVNQIFGTTGIYNHARNGGAIPTASWNAASNINITGVTNTAPAGLSQTFGNLTWNSTQSAAVSLNASPTISGNFVMQSTGGQTLRLTGSAVNQTLTVGNFSLVNGNLELSNQNGNSGILIVSGIFSQSAGTTITKSGSNANNEIRFTGATDVTPTLSGTINSTGTNPLIFNANKDATKRVNLPTNQSFDATVELRVTTGILDMGTSASTVTVNGPFSLMAAGTIDMIGNIDHVLNLAGLVNYTAGGTLVQGSDNQAVIYLGAAQDIMPLTYRNLVLDGTSTKTLNGTTTVDNNLVVEATTTLAFGTTSRILNVTGNISGNGAIDMSSAAGHALNLSGINSTGGAFTAGTGTFNYNGTDQSIRVLSGVNSYYNLTLSNGGTKTLSDASPLEITGALDISSSTLAFRSNAAQVVTVAGNLSGNGTINMSSGDYAHNLNLGGSTNAIGTLTSSTSSTVNYNRSGAQTIFPSVNYRNLTLSGSGTKTMSANTYTVNGDLTISSGATLDANTATLAVTGSTSVAGAFIDGSNTGANTFTGLISVSGSGTWTSTSVTTASNLNIRNGITHSSSGTLSFGAATFSTNIQEISIGNSTGNISFASPVAANANLTIKNSGTGVGAGSLTFSGNLTIGSDIVITNQRSVTITGALNGTNGNSEWLNDVNSTLTYSSATTMFSTSGTLTATAAGNTVIYNGGSAQTVAPYEYNNLTISGAGLKTLNAGNHTVNGTLTITSTTLKFDLGAAQSLSVIGNLTGDASSTIDMTGTGLPHILILGGESNTLNALSTTANSGSTVEYSRAGIQNIFASANYQNLTISGSNTKTLSGGITVNGNLNLSSGTLDLGSAVTTANIIGNAVVDGTLSFGITNPKTFNITGNLSGVGTINMTGATLAHNLNLSGATNTINTFNTTAGSGSTVNYNGTNQSVFSSSSYRNLTFSGSGTKTADGNISLDATLNNSVTLNMSTYTLGLGSTTNNSGTIRFSGLSNGLAIASGTIEYFGATQNVTSGTYNNLTLSNAVGAYTAGGNITVNAGLTTVAGSTFEMGTNTLLGTLSSINNGGLIRTSSTVANPITTGKTWNGTVEYYANTQNVSAGSYTNLDLSNATGEYAAGGSITVTGAFTSASGGILNTSSNINFSGSTICGLSINASAATVTYGASALNILQGTYNNLVIPNTAILCGDITVNGLLTLGTGLDYNDFSIIGLPDIVSVDVPADKTYIIGEQLEFTINFNENVVVTGAPTLGITFGSGPVSASYIEGSGTSALLFRYTILENNNDTDGITLASAITLSGGTIKDVPGNNSLLNLKGVGSTTSILVDGIRPVVTSVDVPADKTYKLGDNLDFIVNYSEDILVDVGTPYINITLNTGGTVNASYIENVTSSSLRFRYTIAEGNLDGNGIAVGGSIVLNGATIKDIPGNNVYLTLNSVGSTTNVLVDGVRPVVNTVAVPANNTYIIDNILNFTVNFSEPVIVDVDIEAPYILITTNVGGPVKAYYVENSGPSALLFRYTISEGDYLNDTDGIQLGGSIVLNDNTTIKDAPGNDIYVALAGVPSTAGILVDGKRPSLAPVTIRSNNADPSIAAEGNEVTVEFEANEAIKDIDVTIGGFPTSVYHITGFKYAAYNVVTLAFPPTIGFEINCKDLAGNTQFRNTTTNGSTVTFDDEPPTISNIRIESGNIVDTLAKVGDVVYLTFKGSEILKDIKVLFYGSKLAASTFNDADSVCTATYTMSNTDTPGNISFTIEYYDLAGNRGVDGTGPTDGSFVKFDKVAPTLSPVTIISNNSVKNNWAKVGDKIWVDFISNEELLNIPSPPTVSIFGNEVFAFETGPTDLKNWRAEYTIDGDDTEGIVQFVIVFNDLAGNTGTPVTSKTEGLNVTLDKTPPTLFNISIVSDNLTPTRAKSGDLVTLTFSASEPVSLISGLDTLTWPTVEINGWNVHRDSIVNTSSNSWRAQYRIGSDPSGPVTFAINYTDRAGNSGDEESVTSSGSQVVVDNEEPVLSAISIVSNNANENSRAKVGDRVTITFVAEETLTDVAVNFVFTPELPELPFSRPATVTNNGLTYSASYTLVADDIEGEIEFTIEYNDLVGNVGTLRDETTNGTSVLFDKTGSTLDPVTIASNNPLNNQLAMVGNTVTVSFTSNEGLLSTSALIGGKTAVVNSTDPEKKIWTASYTMTSVDIEGELSIYIAFQDSTGNQGIAVESTTNLSKVVFDRTKPALSPVAIISSNTDNQRAKTEDLITISFTSTEVIENVTSTINTKNATVISTDGGAGLQWQATYTLINTDNQGTIPFTIDFRDRAGNVGTTVSSTTNGSAVVFDRTLPGASTVSIASNYINTNRAQTGSLITVNFTSTETLGSATATILGQPAFVSNVSGNSWKATYTAQAGDPEGTVGLNINLFDLAGNSISVNSVTDGSIVTFDRTKPSLSPVTIYSDHSNTNMARVGSKVTVEFVSSEPVEFVKATVKGKTAVVENTSGNTWVAFAYLASSDTNGDVGFAVNFKDLSGNSGDQVTSTTDFKTVTFDKVIPTFASVSISSNNTYSTSQAADGDMVTLEFVTSETVETPVTTINGIVTAAIGGPTSWTASRILLSGENEGIVPFTIDIADLAGNQALTRYSTTDGTSVSFDDSEPGIVSVIVASGVYKVGSVISVFIQADFNNYIGQTVEVNGKAQALINNNNNTYTINYTIAENDDQIFLAGSLPVSITFRDASGNTSSRTEATSQGGNITIDSRTPQIASVTSTGETEGILKIGDQLTFTVTPVVAETGLIITPTSYNSKPISWTTVTGDTYTATYTVVEGDVTRETPLQIGTIGIADVAGNAGTPVNYTGVLKTIYTTKPTAIIKGSTTKCDYGQTVPITFEFTGYQPFQLTYSDGTSVFGPVEVDALTYIIQVEGGTFSIVNLTDQKGNFITEASQNATVTVVPLPVLTFNVIGSPFNNEEPRVNLVPYATPSPGQFSGKGVTADGYFYPQFIDEADFDKPILLTYTYTDANGCVNSITDDVIVSSGGAIIEGLQETFCQYEEPLVLTGINPNSVLGQFVVSTSSTGWIDNGDNTLLLSPQEFKAGLHYIKYSYEEGGTIFETNRSFSIDSVGSSVDFVTLNSMYCEDENDVTLLAVNLYPSNGTGHFSGPAIGFSTVINSNSAQFQPRTVTPGTHNVSYYYLSPNGCSSDTVVKEVAVNILPVVDFELRNNYNFDEPAINLVGNFEGGVFSGTGILNNILYPSLITPGSLSVRFTYTDPETGCSNNIEKDTRILKANEVISGLGNSYCYSTDTLDISCVPINDPSVVGEFISARGALVSTETPNQARYAIPEVGNGVDTVFFRYSIEGTPYEVFTRVVVDSIGKVVISGIEDAYCEDHGQVQIYGIDGHPQGSGVFTYTGTTAAFTDLLGGSAIFRPSSENVGDFNITYTYTSGIISTCKSDTTIQVVVNELPEVSFTIPEYYNIEEPEFNLVGEPEGGTFSGQGVVNNVFDPGYAGIGAANITYTYTDNNTCVNSTSRTLTVIGADATITGIPVSGSLCIDGDPILLTASSTNGLPGYFEGDGITNTEPDKATFDPAIAGAGDHTITYKYISSADEQTLLYISRDIEVIDLESVEISSFNDTKEYCYEDDKEDIIGTPVGGEFSGNGIVGTDFYPNLADIGVNEITYTYSDQGCSITGSVEVTVYAMPVVDFSVEQTCSNLSDDPIQFNNLTTDPESIESWLWNFGLGELTSPEFEPEYLYTSAGTKLVTLTATSYKGCAKTLDKPINIGVLPHANFSWINECLNGMETEFTSSSDGAVITFFRWEIEGAESISGEEYESLNYSFPAVGPYDIKLVVTSEDNCLDSITKQINIQPLIRVSDLENMNYFENFEQGAAYWTAGPRDENDPFSWNYGTPTGITINNAASGENAWYTSTFTNDQVEYSQVLSPCFDLRDIKKPMLKFNLFSMPEPGRNGAVLQYTVNNGVKWDNLGDLNTGINWFNSNSIRSQPGGQLVGWSTETNQWVSARHSLDAIKDSSNVRFRIAFAADGTANSSFEGFAFDDMWIGNREQKILLEYFTNTTFASTVSANASMRIIESYNWRDVVAIHYHTSSPVGDPFYTNYPAGSSSRESFYGVSAIPYAIMNGEEPFSFTNFGLNQPKLNIEMLKDPRMSIDVNGSVSTTLNLEVTIKMLEAITNEDLVVHCAVVQKVAELPEPINGVSTFYSILRGFVPDPGGTQIKSTWVAGESETQNFSWNVPAGTNTDMLRVIVYVQNLETGKIYQTGYFDPSPATSTNPKPDEIVVAVFPNPASTFVRLVSPQVIEQATLVDLSGRVVKEFEPNDYQYDIPVQQLVNGFYFIKLKLRNGQAVVRFIKE